MEVRMKSKLLIFLALILVSILVIVFVFVKKGTTTTTGTPTNTTAKEEATKTTPTAATDQGRKCIFTNTDDKGTVSGVVYISGNKSNSVTTVKNVEGVTLEVNNVTDGDYMYSWVTGQTNGTKTKITTTSTGNDAIVAPELGTTESPTGNGCVRWTIDNSKFVAPSNIQF